MLDPKDQVMMRVQTRRTRLWPKATELSYWPISFAPCGDQEIFAGRAVIDRLSHLRGDLTGQIGANARDGRCWNHSAGLHDIRRGLGIEPVGTDRALVRRGIEEGRLAVLHVLRGAGVLAGRLVPLLLAFSPEKLPVSAIYPARRIASTNLGAFIKNAREYFKSDPLIPIEDWEIPGAKDGGSDEEAIPRVPSSASGPV